MRCLKVCLSSGLMWPAAEAKPTLLSQNKGKGERDGEMMLLFLCGTKNCSFAKCLLLNSLTMFSRAYNCVVKLCIIFAGNAFKHFLCFFSLQIFASHFVFVNVSNPLVFLSLLVGSL